MAPKGHTHTQTRSSTGGGNTPHPASGPSCRRYAWATVCAFPPYHESRDSPRPTSKLRRRCHCLHIVMCGPTFVACFHDLGVGAHAMGQIHCRPPGTPAGPSTSPSVLFDIRPELRGTLRASTLLRQHAYRTIVYSGDRRIPAGKAASPQKQRCAVAQLLLWIAYDTPRQMKPHATCHRHTWHARRALCSTACSGSQSALISSQRRATPAPMRNAAAPERSTALAASRCFSAAVGHPTRFPPTGAAILMQRTNVRCGTCRHTATPPPPPATSSSIHALRTSVHAAGRLSDLSVSRRRRRGRGLLVELGEGLF